MKNKSLSLFFLLLNISSHSFAQTKCDCFDRLYNLSNVYAANENWGMAVNTLKDGLVYLDSDKAGHYFHDLADYYTYINSDSAIVYFSKAIQYGYPSDWIKSAHPKEFSKIDARKIKKYELENRAKIDFKVYENYITAFANDQFIRNDNYFPIFLLRDSNSKMKGFIDTLYSKVDVSSFEFIKELFEQYKYPTEHNLGFYPIGIMAFLLHFTAVDNEQSRFIFDKLEQLNKEGIYPEKSTILILKDRQHLYITGKNYCGLSGAKQYASIEQINLADSIRLMNNHVRIEEDLSGNDSLSVRQLRQLKVKGYKAIPYPKNYFCNKKYQFQ